MNISPRSGISRRQFIKTAGAVTGLGAASLIGCNRGSPRVSAGGGLSVSLHQDKDDAVAGSTSVQWAIGRLRETLVQRGVSVIATDAVRSDADVSVHIGKAQSTAPSTSKASESFAITRHPHGAFSLILTGTDSRGLTYAILELVDRIVNSPAASPSALKDLLLASAPLNENRSAGIRSIFRMFVSEVEDKRWFYDRDGWQRYFDMLISNRFNRFNLSFGLSYDFSRNLTDTYTFFMYPFFTAVPGYDVRAVDQNLQSFSPDDMRRNLQTLQFISDQAAMRGLEFNLGIWTHNYMWASSPNATYTIFGLTPQTLAPYSRDAMRLLLQSCSGITGITLRTHGESGIPEGSYDLWKIIMSGVTGLKNADGSDRSVELDLHGKTMTPEMINVAVGTGAPVVISCKLWAEHMGLPYVQASIREQEMPKAGNGRGLMALSSGSRSFLRYGVGDLLIADRKYKVIHRVWPGTQRVLLWGDPLFAAGYGRAASFAGVDGIEFIEPLAFRGRMGSSMHIPAAPDRTGYADDSLRPNREWEKYLYTFRLWGRLSHNPDSTEESLTRELSNECGAATEDCKTALANSSRILPLITTSHLPCAANFAYWPEVYVNMSMYDPGKVGSYGEAPSPKVFGNVTSLDPQIFASIHEYAATLMASEPLAKINPAQVAAQLDAWATQAIAAIQRIGGAAERSRAAVRRIVTDASIAAGVGRFFAHKFRSGICWQLFTATAHEKAKAISIQEYKLARDAWAALLEPAKVYLPDLTWGPERQLRRHWSDRLADIDTDIAGLAAQQVANPTTTASDPEIDQWLAQILNPASPTTTPLPVAHEPMKSFRPNEAIALTLKVDAQSVRLFHRPLHQGKRYQSIGMQKQGTTFAATIPALDAPPNFPLQYYFEISTATQAWLYPGFKDNFTGTPYLLVNGSTVTRASGP